MSSLLDALTSYKKTAGIMAAFEIGLLHELTIERDLESVAAAMNVDKHALECLLSCLTSTGIVEERNHLYRLSESAQGALLYGNIENIIRLEQFLYDHVVTTKAIISRLRKGDSGKCDTSDNAEFHSLYSSVLYGDHLNIISFWIRKLLAGTFRSKAIVLEYVHGHGSLQSTLANNSGPYQYMKLHAEDERTFFAEKVRLIPSIDLFLLYNAIHYLNQEQWIQLMHDFKRYEKKPAYICIADLFYDPHTEFNTTLLLDWLAYGGISHIRVSDVVSSLELTGYTLVKHKNVQSLSIRILIFKKYSGEGG